MHSASDMQKTMIRIRQGHALSVTLSFFSSLLQRRHCLDCTTKFGDPLALTS